MQDFDFAQILTKFVKILPKFFQKFLLGDAAALVMITKALPSFKVNYC